MGQAGVGPRAVRRPSCRQRDRMLETVIAHERIDVLYQPLIEPAHGPDRRRRGAGPLGHCRRSPEHCSRAPPPPASTSGCRAWSSARRCAAPRCGKGRSRTCGLSINLLPEDISRDGYRRSGCWARSTPPGSIPSGSRSKSPKARCWSTRTPSPSGWPAARGRNSHRRRRFRNRLYQPRLSHHAAARHAQDRPRADRRHRRRRAATGSSSRR